MLSNLLEKLRKNFDYQLIGRHVQLIVDTRGVFDGSQPNVVKA